MADTEVSEAEIQNSNYRREQELSRMRLERLSSLIIYGLPERYSSDPTGDRQFQSDYLDACEILSHISYHQEGDYDIANAIIQGGITRLGKRQAERVRPLRVLLTSHAHR